MILDSNTNSIDVNQVELDSGNLVDSPCHKRCKDCGRDIFISDVPNPESVEVVHFEVTYDEPIGKFPRSEPFLTWMKSDPDSGMELGVFFIKEYWCILNHLCVVTQIVDDISINFCVTATKKWVKKKCPVILDSEFIVKPNKDGDYVGSLGNLFLDWNSDNWGIYYIDRRNGDSLDSRYLVTKQQLLSYGVKI